MPWFVGVPHTECSLAEIGADIVLPLERARTFGGEGVDVVLSRAHDVLARPCSRACQVERNGRDLPGEFSPGIPAPPRGCREGVGQQLARHGLDGG